MSDAQTRDVIGESVVPCLASGLVNECFGVEGRVEQRVEGLAGVGVHGVGVLDLVGVEPLEERLVADAT
jgi:hypothetical protein